MEEKLETIPQRIKTIQDNILNHGQTINRMKAECSTVELGISLEVYNAVDASGKKLFSNENSRDAEIDRRLKDNDKYNELDVGIDNASFEMKKLEIEETYLRNTMKVYEIQAYKGD